MPLVDYDSQQQQVVMAKELVQVMKMDQGEADGSDGEGEDEGEGDGEGDGEDDREDDRESDWRGLVKVKVLLESQKMKETL